MGKLRDLLDQKQILLLDGALGTELERQGHDVSGGLWSAKFLLENPEVIQDIHEQYILAGSDLITSSSYQASYPSLLAAGLSEEEADTILKSSIQLARSAIQTVWSRISEKEKMQRIYPLVGASIGPYASCLADGSEYTGTYQVVEKDLLSFHERRMAVLVEAGADFLALETIPNRQEAKVLLELLGRFPQMDAFISFTSQDGETISDGSPIEELVSSCQDIPNIVAIGINCTMPYYIELLLRKMRLVSQKPFLVYPNSGELYDIQSQTWQQNPRSDKKLVDYLDQWSRLGVQIFGGCCRVGPREIQEFRDHLGGRRIDF